MAERRAAALSLDRELLRELLGAEDLRDLIDPVALAELELELQHLAEGRRARNPDDVHDLLRRLGDLTAEEISARSNADPTGWLGDLERDGRAIRLRVAGQERFVAVEDAGRYRDALGASLPLGVPTVFTEPTPAPLEGLVARFARTHGPFGTADVAARFGVGEDRVAGAVASLESQGRVVRGEFRPGGLEREWCDADVLRSIRRRSLAALRKEVEPVEAPALGRFAPEWQAATVPRHGPTALVDAIAQLQGASIPASIVESEVLRSRVRGYRPADLDALCASGDVVWMGAGGIGADDGRIALGFRETLRLVAPPLPETPAGGPGARRAPRAPARTRRVVLARAARRGRRPRRTHRALGAVGPGLGGRDHQRHDRPDAGVPGPPPGEGRPRRRQATAGSAPARRAARGRRALVARADAARTRALADRGRARPSDAAPRTPRRAHARGGPRRGSTRWVRRRVRGAARARGVGQGPARLLRRRPWRGAVRAPRRGRTDPRPPRGAARGVRRRARRGGPGPAVRGGPPLAPERRGGPRGPPAPTSCSRTASPRRSSNAAPAPC